MGADDDRVRIAAQALLVDRVTVEVVEAMRTGGVDCILLKGPSFGRWLYPEGGRAFGDTDLLVAPHEIGAAGAVLRTLGFRDETDGLDDSEHGAAREFVRLRGWSQVVDLHWSLDPGVDAANAWAALRAASEPMPLGPSQVTVLNAAGRAMHVALHAAQHGLTGPRPSRPNGQTGEDLRRAVATATLDDWREAAGLARVIGCEDALALGLRLCPEGEAIADVLGLTRDTPPLWRFARGNTVRGVQRLDRFAQARTPGEKARVLARGIVPTPAHVRRRATSPWGRRSVVGAYIEYWFVAVRDVRAARSIVRAARR